MARLRNLMAVLWRGKWWVVGIFGLVLAAGAAYTYTLPAEYRTSTTLLVEQEQDPVLAELSSGRGNPFGEQTRSLSNEVLVIRQSREIARRVAKRLVELGEHPQTGARLSILYGSAGERLSVQQVAARVQGYVQARTAGREVDAIRISVTSNVPSEAALLSNLYAEEYIARTKEKSRASIRARRTFLEKQAERFQKEVQEAERQLAEYMRREDAVALDQETQNVVEKIAELEARRDQLQIELDMRREELKLKKQEIESIEPRLAERLSSAVGEQLSQVQEEKADLALRIEQIQQRNPDLKPGTPLAQDLAQLKKRRRQLEARADSLARRHVEQTMAANGMGDGDDGRGLSHVVEQRRRVANLRIEISGLEAQLNTVERRLETYREEKQDIPARSIKLAQLQRERRSDEQIYAFVREKLQEARMAEESELGYAEVIRPAGIPRVPVAPNTGRNLVLTALLGLLLGGGFVVVRDRLDTSLRQPEDLQRGNYKVLGVIPSMEGIVATDFGGEETVELDGKEVDTSLIMLTSPMSAVAESYRRLRASLRFARPDADLRTLMVSSPGKGEGKTTTASNLALALASADRKTLLVDADLRNPQVHRRFGLSRAPGLVESLYEEGGARESMDIDNLSVLPAGEAVPNPAELLGSDRMKSLVERVREQFDIVVFDTAPILLFSDPLSLAPCCDGTLMVASSGDTDTRAFDHASELLRDVEANQLGAVLNGFDVSAVGRIGYRYGYGYGYAYGYSYGYRNLVDYYDEESSDGKRGLRAWLGRS